MKKSITLLILLSSFFIMAQNNSLLHIEELKKEFPDEDIVGVNLIENLIIDLYDDAPVVRKRVSKQNVFLSNENVFTEERIHFDKFRTIGKIAAFTDNTSNTIKNKTGNESIWEVTEYEDKDIMDNSVFYSDSKQKTFTYPAVSENSITNLDYEVAILDPHFITPFYLQNRYPLKEAVFSVTVNKNISIAYKTFNIDSVNVTFTEEEVGNNNVYKWVFKDLKETNFDYDFSPTYYVPQIAVYIKSYTAKGENHTVLNDVKDLYTWYQTLIKDINKNNQEELKTIALNLVEGIETEEEKIKAVYYYIQDKINYIAFEDGLNGFIPRDAISIHQKKYGDCKDMANILNEMLQYVGVKSYLTWIGTRSKPYSYSELPTTYTDNHMITAVKLNDDFLFLDATSKYLQFGYPSSFIQGKEALIGLSEKDFEIVKVKEVVEDKNVKQIVSELTFNEDMSIKGKHQVKLTGYRKLDFNHTLSNKEEKDKIFIYKAFNLGNKKTSYADEEYTNLSLSKDTLNVSFTTNKISSVTKLDDEVFIKLNIDSDLKRDLIKGKRKNYAKKIEYKYVTNHTVKLEVPKGYEVSSLPENISFEDDEFGFQSAYKQTKNNTVVLEKKIYVKTLKVNPEKIDTWNVFMKKLSKNNKKSIVIKQKL